MKYAIVCVLLLAGCSHPSSLERGLSSPDIFERHVTANGWVVTPIGGAFPLSLAVDSSHKVWAGAITGAGAGEIVKILMNGETKYFPLSVDPERIAFGPDGNLWITSRSNGGAVARMTPTGQETDFAVGDKALYPGNIVAGPDGAMWFDQCAQDESSGGIGRLDLKGNYTFWQSVCQTIIQSGPDGRIWSGDTGANIYAMTTQGQSSTYPVGDENDFMGSTEGPDGLLYATAYTSLGMELVSVTTNGQVTHLGSNPYGGGLVDLTTGPDGNLWIYDGKAQGHLVMFNPQTQMFGMSIAAPKGSESSIVAGPDGNMWIGDGDSDSVDAYIIQLMTANPMSNTVPLGKQETIMVQEANYAGSWTAASTNLNVATVTPNSQNGTFTVTAVGTGKCSIAIYDSMFNSIKSKVAVQ